MPLFEAAHHFGISHSTFNDYSTQYQSPEDPLFKHAAQAGPDSRKACLPNTRIRIRAEIQNWAVCSDVRRIFILYGGAGMGKSAIIHTVARDLESKYLAVAPFFAFNRSAVDRSLSQLSFTWARHMARRDSKYADYLRTVDVLALEGSPWTEQLDKLLVQGLSHVQTPQPIVFVIDALDECPSDETADLLSILKTLITAPFPSIVRLLFTSRPNVDILAFFKHIAIIASIDDEADTRDDVHTFVESQLRNMPDVAKLTDDVANAAQTVFECAALLCREVIKSRPILSSALADLSQRLQSGQVSPLDATYHYVLQTYISGDMKRLKLFRRLMAVMFLVQSPQPRRVISALMAATGQGTFEDAHLILSYLGSILRGTSTGSDEPVLPFHTSLRDFLVDVNRSAEFFIDLEPRFHEELGLACLRLMNTGLKFNICKLPTSFAMNSEVEDLSLRVDQYISRELRYASFAAAHHLRLSCSTEKMPRSKVPIAIQSPDTTSLRPSVASEVKNFLEKNFLFWLEAHSCMQSEHNGPGSMLPGFRDWLIEIGHKRLTVVVDDFIKFEKRFREGYTQSAPQVYYSGMIFSPRKSTIMHIYGPRFQTLMNATIRGAEDQWSPSEVLVIPTSSFVTTASFSPDGKHIVSGCTNTIMFWDSETGQQLGNGLHGHDGWIQSVAFSPDGKQIVSGSDDMTIRIWDVGSQQQVGTALRGHEDRIWSVAFSPDGKQIVSGSDDMTIRIWDVGSQQQVGKPLRGHYGLIWSVAFSPDGKQIVSGSNDMTVRIWDAGSQQQVGTALHGHDGRIRSVAFSPDGKQIVSGSDDMTIRIWDVGSQQQVGTALRGHDGRIRSVAFSPDGKQIVSGSDDMTIRIWDVGSQQQVGTALRGHDGRIRSVAFSPDGKQIVSGSDDGTVRIWDAGSQQQVYEALQGHFAGVQSIALSPDGKQIVSGSQDRTVRLWDAGGRQRARLEPLHRHNVIQSLGSPPNKSPVVSSRNDDNIIRPPSPKMIQPRSGWIPASPDNDPIWIPHVFRPFFLAIHPCIGFTVRPLIVLDFRNVPHGTLWPDIYTPDPVSSSSSSSTYTV
ncbi:hypothetical protein HGRIS_008891 [Hohenbuehelia grisea]|uniref:NACHT domain-containing protein n=1 Tax=Hohenbuehelia grisea TaxID=104357 RepID=A0ABR3J0V5_9AGAR